MLINKILPRNADLEENIVDLISDVIVIKFPIYLKTGVMQLLPLCYFI